MLKGRPAIMVFVARKVHEQWLMKSQQLPGTLTGPNGVWCDVDVVELSYETASSSAPPPSALHTELAQGLPGAFPKLGPGSQVASEETSRYSGDSGKESFREPRFWIPYKSPRGSGLQPATAAHVPPLPPSHGPGVYLGAVERASSFASDFSWYGAFSSRSPGEQGLLSLVPPSPLPSPCHCHCHCHYHCHCQCHCHCQYHRLCILSGAPCLSINFSIFLWCLSLTDTFVRSDGAFVPFRTGFDLGVVTTEIQGVGRIGPPSKLTSAPASFPSWGGAWPRYCAHHSLQPKCAVHHCIVRTVLYCTALCITVWSGQDWAPLDIRPRHQHPLHCGAARGQGTPLATAKVCCV